ncbi:MAG: hypothetical protein DME21_13805, partial [Verrucomicrobia bacterium]
GEQHTGGEEHEEKQGEKEFSGNTRLAVDPAFDRRENHVGSLSRKDRTATTLKGATCARNNFHACPSCTSH